MKKIIAMAAVLFAQSSYAAVFDFAGLADQDSGIDGYLASISGEKGWSVFSWTVDGLTVEATAWYTNYTGTHAAFAYLDSGDAGMGVCKALYQTQCNPSNDDNIQKNEYLQLKFDQVVSLDQVLMKNGDHDSNFAAGYTFGLDVDGSGFVFYPLNATFDPPDLVGSTFVFKGKVTYPTKEYYINALTATPVTQVPEPETYALMGLGLLAVAVLKRHNKI